MNKRGDKKRPPCTVPKTVILTVGITLAIQAVVLGICAAVLMGSEKAGGMIKYTVWACYLIGGIVCGIVSKRLCGRRSPLLGMICGGAYSLVLLCLSFAFSGGGGISVRIIATVMLIVLPAGVHALRGKSGRGAHRSVTRAPRQRSLPARFS